MAWFDRLLEEQRQLSERIEKLEDFLGNEMNDISDKHRELLTEQCFYMNEYNKILLERIELTRAEGGETDGNDVACK